MNSRVFVNAFTAKYIAFCSISSRQVFANGLNVFTSLGWPEVGVLQSSLHDSWARDRGSYLEDRLRYTPTDCYETFPFPNRPGLLEVSGESYHELRRKSMILRREGLTKIYNRFHDPSEQSNDILDLRMSRVSLDRAVAVGYGWSGVDLGHGFHQTKEGVRFTLSETARRAVLDGLVSLNHRRHEEEVASGLHERKAGTGKRGSGKKKLEKPTAQGELL
jgi:hypothetical protein